MCVCVCVCVCNVYYIRMSAFYPVACNTCVISPAFHKNLACRNTSSALKYMKTKSPENTF